jgi:hypothetical protein
MSKKTRNFDILLKPVDGNDASQLAGKGVVEERPLKFVQRGQLALVNGFEACRLGIGREGGERRMAAGGVRVDDADGAIPGLQASCPTIRRMSVGNLPEANG